MISWANAAYLNEDSYILVYFNSYRKPIPAMPARTTCSERWQNYSFSTWAGTAPTASSSSPITVTVDQNALQTFEVAMAARSRRHNGVRLLSGRRAARGSVVLARDTRLIPASGPTGWRASLLHRPRPRRRRRLRNRCRRCRRRLDWSGDGQYRRRHPRLPHLHDFESRLHDGSGSKGHLRDQGVGPRRTGAGPLLGARGDVSGHRAARTAGKRLAGVLAVTIRGDRDARAFTLVKLAL